MKLVKYTSNANFRKRLWHIILHVFNVYICYITFFTNYIKNCFAAGDPNSWRLGRIDETDHETAV